MSDKVLTAGVQSRPETWMLETALLAGIEAEPCDPGGWWHTLNRHGRGSLATPLRPFSPRISSLRKKRSPSNPKSIASRVARLKLETENLKLLPSIPKDPAFHPDRKALEWRCGWLTACPPSIRDEVVERILEMLAEQKGDENVG